MNIAILIAAFTTTTFQLADTTVSVPPGARLEMRVMGGSVEVDTWDADQIRVLAEHGRRETLNIRTSDSVVRIDTRREGGFPGSNTVNYRLTVPHSMDLDFTGMNVDIQVIGGDGQLNARTVSGEIVARRLGGAVVVQSVSGDVEVEGAAETVTAMSTSGDVFISDASGPLDARAVSGNVILERISSPDVEAYTVSGRIRFEGSLNPNGIYTLATHSGSITLVTPEAPDAALTLATNSGRFSTTIPSLTTIDHSPGRRRTYTVGNGSAVIELETFSGDIRILTPEGSFPP